MSLQKTLDKIDSEFENGLRFKATDRLRNLIQDNPNEIELWNKLAEFYYESGFLDAAGKYWILTEPTEDRIKKCVEIYEKSLNYSGYQILQEIVFRGDKSQLPKYAQQKLTELEADSKKKMNYVPKFSPKLNGKKKNNSQEDATSTFTWFGVIFFSVLAIFGILMIVGVFTVFSWIF